MITPAMHPRLLQLMAENCDGMQLDPLSTENEVDLRLVFQLAFELGQEFHAAPWPH